MMSHADPNLLGQGDEVGDVSCHNSLDELLL